MELEPAPVCAASRDKSKDIGRMFRRGNPRRQRRRVETWGAWCGLETRDRSTGWRHGVDTRGRDGGWRHGAKRRGRVTVKFSNL